MADNPEWRSVVGFEEHYIVSNRGDVMRVKGGSGAVAGRILKLRTDKNGYFCVDLCVEGKKCTRLVHKLVVGGFIGQIPNDREVNHKNGVKVDNRVSNLEIVTHLENMQHAVRNGLFDVRGGKNWAAKLTENQVREIRRLYALGNITQASLSRRYGLAYQTISKIIRRTLWRHI